MFLRFTEIVVKITKWWYMIQLLFFPNFCKISFLNYCFERSDLVEAVGLRVKPIATLEKVVIITHLIPIHPFSTPLVVRERVYREESG